MHNDLKTIKRDQRLFSLERSLIKKPSSRSNMPLSLKNPRFPDRLQGGITGVDGTFSFEIFPGRYTPTEYISFESNINEGVILRESTDLGTIALEISVAALDEVELVAERTEVEIRLDKRVYNVGRDITVRGGSVSDVMDNIPSVSVDVEGNISLRGNDNVRILINGKPSGLVGLSGPDALRRYLLSPLKR